MPFAPFYEAFLDLAREAMRPARLAFALGLAACGSRTGVDEVDLSSASRDAGRGADVGAADGSREASTDGPSACPSGLVTLTTTTPEVSIWLAADDTNL